MRRFRSEQLPTTSVPVCLSRASSHHLLHVIRQTVGDTLILFNGAGQQVEAQIDRVQDGLAWMSATGPLRRVEPAAPLYLLIGMPKNPAFEHALRMSTEAGVTHIIPVLSTFSVQRSDAIKPRWTRILQSAAQQCGRADVPSLTAPASLLHGLEALPTGVNRWFAHPGGDPILASDSAPSALLVGPEGGLSPEEIDLALRHDFKPLGLGRWIFRTETACAVGLARLTL